MKFQIMDAFTEELFGGNPAGVVIIDDDGKFPDDETMRRAAAELRYSETAFVKRIDEHKFQTRYFTPAAEVELCGHATIATFGALYERGIIEDGKIYQNDTLSGLLNIQVDGSMILMDMAKPQILDSVQEEKALEELYRIMGIGWENQGIYDGNSQIAFIPKMVSTGLVDIILPVRNEEELEAIDPDFKALSHLSERYNVVGVHAFTINSNDGLIHARNFAPLYEIDEEAATGTANGALTYYLYDYGLIEKEKINVVIQGEKMMRPSRILTKSIHCDGDILIQVGGPAVTLAKGEINL